MAEDSSMTRLSSSGDESVQIVQQGRGNHAMSWGNVHEVYAGRACHNRTYGAVATAEADRQALRK